MLVFFKSPDPQTKYYIPNNLNYYTRPLLAITTLYFKREKKNLFNNRLLNLNFYLVYISIILIILSYIKLDNNPKIKSKPASMITIIMIINSIQIANFNRYQPIIAAIIITIKNITHDTFIKAKIIFLHLICIIKTFFYFIVVLN